MSEIRSQVTPARDELAALILAEPNGWRLNRDNLATRILDAGWSKPRTVNSATELDALPAGTVLRNNKSGRVFEKARDKGAGKSKWMRMQDRWVYETYEILNESTWTVLFTPGDAE
ncbi:hypothetical protein J6K27_003507 [Rhodococcus qingshengii]|uniref:hypothetical protein n=1 Tax=Rhodococcus qingshengii TaxID=334542 RepID=UPI001AEF7B96|nr:hypothetical protein [Rhodococcus qingshengii]QTR98379.1 hypothetical protein J6K27_003507 [Rhodococcus qingshengii]